MDIEILVLVMLLSFVIGLMSGVLLSMPRGRGYDSPVILPCYGGAADRVRPGCLIALVVMTIAALLFVILRG